MNDKEVARAIVVLADVVQHAAARLGLNNADTGMGAIEVLAKEIRDGSRAIASGLHAIADSRRLEPHDERGPGGIRPAGNRYGRN
ncbi:hypothetical protein [Aminivibrio sp.]|uniref:hypothetical protein n=1 Tax=Aminivibrio sp. TaxID=1872489 RepID=UPI00345E1F6B